MASLYRFTYRLKNAAFKYLPAGVYTRLRSGYRSVFNPAAFTSEEGTLPAFLGLSTTLKCMAACPHCYFLQSDRQALNASAPYMDPELVRSIFSQPWAAGIASVCLSGGESLLHPRLFELVDIAKEHGVQHVTVVTNGLSLLRQDVVERLEANYHKLTNLHVSLDAIDEESYCRAKGIKKCDFEKLLEQIRKMAGLMNAVPDAKMGTSFVVGKHNIGQMDKMIRLAEDLGLGSCQFTALHVVGADRDEKVGSSLSDLPPEFERAMKRNDYKIDITLQPPINKRYMTYFCESLARHLLVGPEGLLAPCCHLPWTSDCGQLPNVIGNPIDNEVARKMRRAFMEAKRADDPSLLPEPCRMCNRRMQASFQFIAKQGRWLSL